MHALAPLVVSLGALAIAAAPAWFILWAETAGAPRARRARLRFLLAGYTTITALLGLGWILGSAVWLGQDASPALAFAGLLLLAALPSVVWTARTRARAARRRAWRSAHPDEDTVPETRAERRAAADIELIRAWYVESTQRMQSHLDARGWVTTSLVTELNTARPTVGLDNRRTGAYLASLSGSTRNVLEYWRHGIHGRAQGLNQEYVQQQKTKLVDFFDSVESSPLTDEQIEAVICLDDRVRLIAAAGSGKTSTLTAKAVYLIESGFVTADRLLVVAFNRAAAEEARGRIADRLRARGLSQTQEIESTTFHRLGRKLTGRARRRMPSTPSWVEGDGRRRAHVAEIVHRLESQDETFKTRWRLFHALYGGRETFDALGPDSRDHQAFPTRSGIEVKSRGEQLIADWLWFQGVEFEYERPYTVDLATEERRQYAPDFYYPSADLWHEHFALDRTGAAPAAFEGYLDGVHWKRRTHRDHGSALIETITAEVDDGTLLAKLENKLLAAGVVFDEQRAARTMPANRAESNRTHDVLQKLLSAARADGLDDEALRARATQHLDGTARQRALLLLDLLQSVQREWERDLEEADGIDFDGMILEANLALETGVVTPEYDMILVDEFQDLSGAFGRLLRNLLRRSGARLFAVGDDWQAINGFAGADVDEMLRFDERFGEGTTLRLERTFRSAQAICDAAGAFVMRNGEQLPKEVVSSAEAASDGVRVRVVRNRAAQQRMLQRYLDYVQAAVDRQRGKGQRERTRSVLVLGRYNWLDELLPERSAAPSLDVRFCTVHGSKGLEADHVVVLDVVAGSDGFPSTKADDPALALTRRLEQSYPHAEERRLLYVALTRARRSALVLTVEDRLSPFVTELVELGAPIQNETDDAVEVCPSCGSAVLVRREGRYGPWQRCARHGCSYTRSLGAPAPRADLISPSR